MPPGKKLRAAEARSRRLLLRYEREIRAHLQPSSSDDDVIPPPRQGTSPLEGVRYTTQASNGEVPAM